jgi:quinol monooxygenase YgiN
MIVVMGTLKLADQGVERLRSAIAAMVPATRAEPGCDHYALAADLDDPDLLHVSERWVDQAALGLHLVTDHVIDFQMAMRRTRILKASVNIYYPDGSVKKWINT